ncbi:unnamed protein product [Chrysoparadoxa australica]
MIAFSFKLWLPLFLCLFCHGSARRQSQLRKSPDVSASAALAPRTLTFYETMVAGAVSRSVAQTAIHPANVAKTLLQTKNSASQLKKLSWGLMTRGAGAQFILSLPHGAFNFATLETVRHYTGSLFPGSFAGPILDFLSSSVATTISSIISTPQMVLTDRIMAGVYPNLREGVQSIRATEGVRGFYTGWFPNLAQKIPSYGLTWMFFQQFKRVSERITQRAASHAENVVLGSCAAAATVCMMIPLDTVKTRIVTQGSVAGMVPYKGITDCFTRVIREEGVGSLYRALGPRLAAVVPMIGIQFGVYEMMKSKLMHQPMLEMLGPEMSPELHAAYLKEFIEGLVLLEEELV